MKQLSVILAPAFAGTLVAFLSYPGNFLLTGFAFVVSLGLSCSISRLFLRH